MPDASLVAFLVLEMTYDITRFPSQEGNKSSLSDIDPRKMGLTFNEFLCPEYSSRPKIVPHVYFSNFRAEEKFSFLKFFRCLDEKRAAATLLIDQFR